MAVKCLADGRDAARPYHDYRHWPMQSTIDGISLCHHQAASPKFAAFYSMISAENEIFSACFRL
jgi:hypothetical protein